MTTHPQVTLTSDEWANIKMTFVTLLSKISTLEDRLSESEAARVRLSNKLAELEPKPEPDYHDCGSYCEICHPELGEDQ